MAKIQKMQYSEFQAKQLLYSLTTQGVKRRTRDEGKEMKVPDSGGRWNSHVMDIINKYTKLTNIKFIRGICIGKKQCIPPLAESGRYELVPTSLFACNALFVGPGKAAPIQHIKKLHGLTSGLYRSAPPFVKWVRKLYPKLQDLIRACTATNSLFDGLADDARKVFNGVPSRNNIWKSHEYFVTILRNTDELLNWHNILYKTHHDVPGFLLRELRPKKLWWAPGWGQLVKQQKPKVKRVNLTGKRRPSQKASGWVQWSEEKMNKALAKYLSKTPKTWIQRAGWLEP